ncbi:MAG: retroviral-like aspartic protease family protein [Betaproteobacteria bacterium]|nr:retroviral-like aspartic protease family protein [Betaproteobacteria bacterium]
MPKLRTLTSVAVWLFFFGALYFYISGKFNPNTAEKLGSSNQVVLARDLSGHYHAEAFIDGTKVIVLVDTGATDVAISQALADKIGIKSHSAIQTQTANGNSVGFMTRLKSIKIGGIEVSDVAATIVPKLSGADALLGMSFLNRMDINLHNGVMTIKQAE